MHPWLVYHSRILPDNSIATLLFDGQTGSAKPDPFPPFPDVSRARSITNDAWMQLASGHQVAIDGTRRDTLLTLEEARTKGKWSNGDLVAELSHYVYDPLVKKYAKFVPKLEEP